jgi:2-dehydro-3-deoxyphosphogluconate aldolase/(4S)-4-hydroxy-2-oxoglutarate aldolase
VSTLNSVPAPSSRARRTRALLRHAGILPVVTVDSAEQGVAIGRALLEGGLGAIEVTLRSPAAMDAIAAIAQALPALSTGAGTIRNAAQAREAVARGASFLVTPATPPALARELAAMEVLVVPGVATPSEACALYELGFDALKLFPATSVGGAGLLRSMAAPLPEIAFCPTGGITEASAADFLRLPNVLCIGGSWMVAPDWIAQGRYDLVRESAARARAILDALPR